MSILDDFKIRFSEFAEGDVDKYIPIYEPELPIYYGFAYDANTKEIILNLLAHLIMIELRRSKTSVRPIASRSIGGVSTSFDVGNMTSTVGYDFFKTTAYGQRFYFLIQSGIGVVAV